MLILDPSQHTPLTIDAQGTQRFEAFLDRNYPRWRETASMGTQERDALTRSWEVGIDDVERTAIYRGEFVEIYDEYYDKDTDGEILIHTPQHRICSIDGDLTPVAVWGKRAAKPN